MIAVDTNVLVYAHRRHLPQHKPALNWLSHLSARSTPWAIPVFCIGEFLRVVTHPKVFDPPSTLDQAWASIRAVIASPSVRLLAPGPHHALLLEEEMRRAEATGNLVFDAQIAALCREHGVDRILTSDRDFSRFNRLTIVSINEPPG